MVFTLTPTQHNSGRGLLDQGATLWGSWVVKQLWLGDSNLENRIDTGENEFRQKGKEKEASVWFAGDTGYQTSDGPCPVFKGRFSSHI
jgi:N-acyl-phosphatidylethanolamine-hydrolysing phospholipase D